MTTKHSTIASDPWAKPAPRRPERPEERERAVRAHQQAHKNMEYLDEIFDDLLREHLGRMVIVYGDCQVLIGDDGYKMEQSLTEEERRTVVALPISKWWLRHGAE